MEDAMEQAFGNGRHRERIMTTTAIQAALAIGSGGVIGLVLGLVGGGGSILAVPLLVYLVGIPSPHVAIGTAAVAVALNAAFGLVAHARQGTVKWRCALVFAGAGIVGSAIGATAGKAVDGQRLLALFGGIMIVVALAMLHGKSEAVNANVRLSLSSASVLLPWLLGTGFGVGLLSGFFGIGGGFLIVPGLILATGMPLTNAVGTSLLAVTAFGLTTAATDAVSSRVDWPVAALLLIGGATGSVAGIRLNIVLAQQKRLLTVLFSGVVMAVGAVLLIRGLITSSGA